MSLVTKHLGPRRRPVLHNVRGPLGVLDLAFVGPANIKKRKASFAAKGVAIEDRGEDRSSIDLPQSGSSSRLPRCDHFLALDTKRMRQRQRRN